MGNEVYRRSVLKFICFLSVVILLSSGCQGSTVTSTAAAQKAVEYEFKTVPRPAYGVLGGEWTVFALSRLGVQLPEGYEEIYMTSLKQTVKETRGKLSEDKYTEYSRVCLALAALGEASTVEGFDLLENLEDFDRVVSQGLNGAVYALLALDAHKNQSSVKQAYVDYIVEQQNSQGGFSFLGKESSSEADMTAMVLQCLAPYKDQEKVQNVLEKGVELLSLLQSEQGGYESGGEDSSESISQAVIALCTLGIDCNGEDFRKEGKGLLDRLLEYEQKDGSFSHTGNGEGDLMATDQALCALAAYERWQDKKTALYDMSDVK